MSEKNGPPRHQRATGQSNPCTQHYNAPRLICKLYGLRIFDRFPLGCPLATETPIGTIQALRDRAYSRLADGWDVTGGLDDVDRAELCSECVARAMGRSDIYRLRRLATRGGKRA